MKMIERDRMPIEVATEMACAPWSRRTNRERKMLRDSRQTEWASEASKKPLAEKLARKAQTRPIEWLQRQNKRTAKKRRSLQRKYETLMRLEQTPVVAKFVAALNLQAAQLDLLADSLVNETNNRLNIAKGITATGVSFLVKPPPLGIRVWVTTLGFMRRKTDFPRYVSLRRFSAE